ncbi:hypothetical protein AZOA_04480 [Azoarcus sp. Aa7]|nr:hypothetical protein [Azoarcus sp. Aa7]
MSTEDFSDDRVFIVRPGDHRLGLVWSDERAGYEQACDGPIFAVVGANASDEKLGKLSQRFGFEISELRRFRDTEKTL